MNRNTRVATVALVGLTGCATAATAYATASGPSTPQRSTAAAATKAPPPQARAPHDQAPERTAPTERAAAIKPLTAVRSGTLDKTKARSVIRTVIERPVAKLPNARAVNTVFSPLTEGRFLSELKAQRGELQENGWTQHGEPTVISVTITSQTAKKATVSACIDQSDVSVRDADGKSIGTSDVPRAKHVYDLVQQPDGAWRIARHRFPANPTC